jgi:hypothetical protein
MSDKCVHIHTICTNTFSIGCAQHTFETNHRGDSVNGIMKVLLIVTEGRQLNMELKYYVYFKETYIYMISMLVLK